MADDLLCNSRSVGGFYSTVDDLGSVFNASKEEAASVASAVAGSSAAMVVTALRVKGEGRR